MLNGDLGLWLERVLHVPNSTKGDSPKMAGLLTVLRVQGRWGAAARLAWLRVCCSSASAVSGDVPLAKDAPNSCPGAEVWDGQWAPFFEARWQQHIGKIVQRVEPGCCDEPRAGPKSN